MPVIEFFGYAREEALRKMKLYKPLLADLDFAADIVFVINDTRVIGLNNVEQPLLQIRSRSPERLEATRRILNRHEDVETLVIDFQARTAD